VRFPRAEIDRRLAKARDVMVTADIDLLLVDHAEFMAWLTGYTVSETMYRAAFLPREAAGWLVLRELDTVPCRAASWFEDIVGFADSADPVAVIAAEIQSRGYASGRIGVDFRSYGFTASTFAALSSRLPAVQFINLAGISDRLRAVKSAPEIAILTETAAIADKAMERVRAATRAGKSPRAVAAVAAAAFLENGADSRETGPIVVGRGDQGFLHAAMTGEPLQPEDVLHVELIPKVQNYSARLMRPVVVGGRNDRLEQTANRLVDIQDRQIAAMRPDIRACEIDAIVRNAVLAAGLRDRYENVTGYALGLYARTPRPSDFSHAFLPTADWRLEEGMTFHMYVSARGLGFSETVLVTAAGGRRLTATPRRLLYAS